MSTFPRNLKTWLVSELGAAAAVIAAVGGSDRVLSWGPEMPQAPGVYIFVGGDPDSEAFATECEVRIRIIPAKAGEAECWTAAEAVVAALQWYPGFAKTWNVAPSSKTLRIKSIRRTAYQAPERDGAADNMFAALVTYDMKGLAA